MCATCGCSDDAGVRLVELGVPEHSHGHDHAHNHEHAHPHAHSSPAPTVTISLEQQVLAKNDVLAAETREWLTARGAVAINLMSSPGSGKTTLLEATLHALAGSVGVCVIEGDQETTFDAERLHAAGAPVVQVNTGAGCHLDAAMVHSALHRLDPDGGLVLIENVGNLVCPALFDLGEAARVVIMSVTEGADKPRKYPHIFRSASLVVLNKIDLLPYVDFDVDRFAADVALLKPAAEIVQLSATRPDGMSRWLDWLAALMPNQVIGATH